MKIDPARWPERVQMPVLIALLAALVGCLPFAADNPMGRSFILLGPALFGGLIWRFDVAPWTHILSWTVPMTVCEVLLVTLIPGNVGRAAASLVGGVWMTAFIFWSPPVRWWYRWVLRSQNPYTNRRS